MPEKTNDKTGRHAWPPPKESERVVTPYYFVTTEEKGAITHYTLVRVVNGKPAHVIGTTKYKDLLETIIQDSLVPVFKPTQRQYIEATLGEARWMYNVANGDEPDN
jgi:hypothetical protein